MTESQQAEKGMASKAARHKNRLAFANAPDEAKGDRETVLAVVSKDGVCLQWAAAELKKDREVVLAAVLQQGQALKFAARELRHDEEVVLAALTLSQHLISLSDCTEEARANRKIVLAAVSKDAMDLRFAASELKTDRDIVLAAIARDRRALRFAADGILNDTAFAVEARKELYFFKIIALSGRSCIIALLPFLGKHTLLMLTCNKLGLEYSESQDLLHGAHSVPDNTEVSEWPGCPLLGGLTEYQLLSSKRARTE